MNQNLQIPTIDVLKLQLAELSSLISDPNSNIDPTLLSRYLSNLFYFVSFYNLSIKPEISFNRIRCLQCSTAINRSAIVPKFSLPCKIHVFCTFECARDYIALYTENQILNYSKLICISCNIPVPRSFFDQLFGQEEFRNMLNQASSEIEAKFTCDICMGEFPISQGITLDCNHRYCKECLVGYLTAKIADAQITDEDLSCPQGDGQKINVNVIKYIVPPDAFEKYERFVFNAWKPDDLANDELFFECHGVNCVNRIILPITQESYKCAVCGFESCPRCGDVIHKGSSCEAFKRWKEENSQGDAKFLELMKQSQWVVCPWCNQAIERTSGCKYMSCFSSACRGKKYFCFDCKQGLAGDHARHACTTPG